MPERISPKPHAGGRTDRPASVYLDTTGNPSLGIGLCQRCQFKFPLHMLQDDPNIPGFKVCEADRDSYDPYRMPARQADKITLPYIRPDVPLSTGPTGILVFVNDMGQPLSFINQADGILEFFNESV